MENENKGIEEFEIDAVIKHIRKSSFYVMTVRKFCWISENCLAMKPLNITMFVVIFSAYYIYGLQQAFLMSVLIAIFLLFIIAYIDHKLWNYYFYNLDEPVNDLTFKELEKDEPTMRYIFSGDFRGMGRDDLTNNALCLAYDNLIIHQKMKKNKVKEKNER